MTEVDLNTRCQRCGHEYRWHLHLDGTPRQGWQASRFTGQGWCDGEHMSGGASGMRQRCGCTGFEESGTDRSPSRESPVTATTTGGQQ